MRTTNLDEQDEADAYENFAARSDSSTGEMTKPKARTHRSKHSETEQRRRIKINERFQTLMDVIPQNDKKRDKASFLLEIIEYIQFLQEKIQMHEGSPQMLNQGPTKLTPWRNNHKPAEDFFDHCHEKIVVPQVVHSDVPNSLDSEVEAAAALFKAPDHSHAYTKTEENMAASAMSYISAQTLLQSVQHGSWQDRPCSGSAVNDIKEQENSNPDSSASSSTIYSQVVLKNLTKALRSSGVDLSQATISVQLNLAKRTDSQQNDVVASASKDNDSQITGQKRVRR